MSIITTFTDHAMQRRRLGDEPIALKNHISFADTSVSAADVVELIDIPAYFKVLDITILVTTAEGATCTATIGDGDATDGWDASVNLNSAAAYISTPSDTYGATGGKVYTTADTIDAVMGHDTDAAILDITVHGYFVNRAT